VKLALNVAPDAMLSVLEARANSLPLGNTPTTEAFTCWTAPELLWIETEYERVPPRATVVGPVGVTAIVTTGGGRSRLLLTLRRPPVPTGSEAGSTPASILHFTSFTVSVGSLAMRSVAAPVTWGVAMEVPSKTLYVLFGVVERIPTPGAERSTVTKPKFEKEASASLWSVAATDMILGRL